MPKAMERKLTGYFSQGNSESSSIQKDQKSYKFITTDNYTFSGNEDEEITKEDEVKFYKKAFETKNFYGKVQKKKKKKS